MIRTQIQLDERQAAALRQMAVLRKVSMAELVRRAVDEYTASPTEGNIDAKRKAALAAAGRFRSGVTDLGSRHDEHLGEAFRR